jgi:hypothetical protein
MEREMKLLPAWPFMSTDVVDLTAVDVDDETDKKEAEKQRATARAVVEAFVERTGGKLTSSATTMLYLLILSTIRNTPHFHATTGRVNVHEDTFEVLGVDMQPAEVVETILGSGASAAQLEDLIPIVEIKQTTTTTNSTPASSSGSGPSWTNKTVKDRKGKALTLPAEFGKLSAKEKYTWCKDHDVELSQVTGNGASH